jgi:hypothetical protein
MGRLTGWWFPSDFRAVAEVSDGGQCAGRGALTCCFTGEVKRTSLDALLTPKWWFVYTLVFVGLPVANLVWIATTTNHDLGGPTGVVVVPAALIAAGWIAIWRRRQ